MVVRPAEPYREYRTCGVCVALCADAFAGAFAFIINSGGPPTEPRRVRYPPYEKIHERPYLLAQEIVAPPIQAAPPPGRVNTG